MKQLRITGQQEGTSDWKSVQVSSLRKLPKDMEHASERRRRCHYSYPMLSFPPLKMVLLILGCFTICWLPYFIVACSQIYRLIESSSAVAYMAAFTLAMSNSAMNPLIYAWKNSNFRHAFINLLKCRSPDALEPSQSMRSNLHRKSSSAQHQENLSGAFPNYSTPPFMQRKIDPINEMGITFEEDEDKISTHEIPSAKSDVKVVSAPVAIKIESDVRNSIIISTRTLPASPEESRAMAESMAHMTATRAEGRGSKTGSLIVNRLTENYGFDSAGDVQRFKDNFLTAPDSSVIKESSKFKSKSANSIAITKSPHTSPSHGSFFENGRQRCISNETTFDAGGAGSRSVGKTKFFPSFKFNRKYISRSFNNRSSLQTEPAEKSSFRNSTELTSCA